ncbi:hypothetical protein [Desulfolutivibrio sulfoxidireducens]|uniref:hypothetical protein n=1 Tax=Desulfolutivibrio sulfoxidireducens TaxID=2773299 RepID=UPI00159DB21A|nr:hypothetical protein [Desulfolutivibrio sulfoxidireducens]QLA16039.1 hypothetical protein GD605_07775 [Desulfolutivibrio sulfoxidireducens]QLA20051.1 hypothetical protein GD604_10110 [Desulfolutivibrio sulfoxidireducens]
MRSSGIAGKVGAFGAGFFGALWVGGTAGTLMYKLVSLVLRERWPELPVTDIFPSLAALSRTAMDLPELSSAIAWLGQADLLTAFAVIPLAGFLCCLTLVERPGDFFSPRAKTRPFHEAWNAEPSMFGRPRPGSPGRGPAVISPDKAGPASSYCAPEKIR